MRGKYVVWMVDRDQFPRRSMRTTAPAREFEVVSDGITKLPPQVGITPSGKEAEMHTKLLAAIGSGAMIASALIVAVTDDPGQALAGSNHDIVNTFTQPTQPAMSEGATFTAGAPATTLTTSKAAPTAKATPLKKECPMPGRCL
jgi:hypothetical protein